jgi:hypothetical protein
MSDRCLNALVDLTLAGNFVVWFCAEREVVQRRCQRRAGILRGHGCCCCLSIRCHATYFFPQRSPYTSNIRKACAGRLKGLSGASRLSGCSDVPPPSLLKIRPLLSCTGPTLSDDILPLMAVSLSWKAGRHVTCHAQEQPVRILPDSLNSFQPDDVSCSHHQQESYRLSAISGRSGLAGDCVCLLTDAMRKRGTHNREKLEFSEYWNFRCNAAILDTIPRSACIQEGSFHFIQRLADIIPLVCRRVPHRDSMCMRRAYC